MKRYFLVPVLILLAVSCASDRNIPEISTNLHAVRLENISLDPTVFSVLGWKNNIFISDLNGTIKIYSPEKKDFNTIVELKTKIRNRLFAQNGTIVIRKAKTDDAFVFEFNEKKIISKIKLPGRGRIIGVDVNHLIYLKKKEIIFLDHINNHIIYSIDLTNEKIINCELRNKMIFILSSRSLLIFDLTGKELKRSELGASPSSPFSLFENHLYFGDTGRNLVRYSIKKNRVLWKYKLPKRLKTKPILTNGLILAGPEDNNLYLITKNGGLKQWYRTEAGHIFDPVIMKDNIAVFLRSGKGTTINFYGINKISRQTLKDETVTLKTQPIHCRGNIYSLGSEIGNTEIKLIKLGNKFGSIIKTIPAKDFETGRSIRFGIEPVNMVKPDIEFSIYNSAGLKIFSEERPSFRPGSIAWIPLSGGEFTAKVIVKVEKGIISTDIKKFFVTDVKKIYKDLHIKLQRECNNYSGSKQDKDEKSDGKISDK